jgi:hypothetical protein
MSAIDDVKAAVEANSEETKRVAKAYEDLAAAMQAMKGQFDELSASVAGLVAYKSDTEAKLAEIKEKIEADTAEEAKIGAATSGGSTGGMND